MRFSISRLVLILIIGIAYLFFFLSISIVQFFILLVITLYIPEILERIYGISSRYGGIICGLSVLLSFQFNQGIVSGLIVIPWLIYGSIYSILTNPYFGDNRQNIPTSQKLLLLSSSIFFMGAPAALILSRAGLQPLGFSHTIIELTAIHFHYSGISIPLFVNYINRYLDRELFFHNLIIALGTPIVAVGITLGLFYPIVGLFSVILFSGDLLILSGLFIIHRWDNGLIVFKTVHLIFMGSMSLAIYYAVGAAFLITTISISRMIITHGVLNGLLFVPVSIYSWPELVGEIY